MPNRSPGLRLAQRNVPLQLAIDLRHRQRSQATVAELVKLSHHFLDGAAKNQPLVQSGHVAGPILSRGAMQVDRAVGWLFEKRQRLADRDTRRSFADRGRLKPE